MLIEADHAAADASAADDAGKAYDDDPREHANRDDGGHNADNSDDDDDDHDGGPDQRDDADDGDDKNDGDSNDDANG